MKKLTILFLMLLLVALLSGCGQNAGTNPEGTIGGSDQGYGEQGSYGC